MKNVMNNLIKIVIAIVVALVSIFGVAKYMENPEHHAGTITYLDEKKGTVMELVGVATVASIGVSAIPGDATTPLANTIFGLSEKFVIVIGAIYLEKYLTTLSAYIGFEWLIPFACLLYIIYVLTRKEQLKGIVIKLSIFAIVLNMIVPASVQISKTIENTSQVLIQETIDQGNVFSSDTDEDKSWLDKTIDKIENVTTYAVGKAKAFINSLIESLAIMIITSCVIPLLILAFLLWFMKLFIGLNISFSSVGKLKPISKAKEGIKELSNN